MLRSLGLTSALLTRLSHPVIIICVVDAIIFLAPISGFDQVLAEDRSVNRLVRTIKVEMIDLLLI